MGLWSYKSTNHISLDCLSYYYMKVASYDGSFMGVLDDLVNFVSSFHEFYKSVYAIAPKCSNWQNSFIIHSCSPYGYGNDLSEVRSSSGSSYPRMRLTVSSLFSCPQNVIHYCIEILPLRTCMYVVRILLLVVLPPQIRVLGGVRTVSVRPPGVPYVSVGPLSKRTL